MIKKTILALTTLICAYSYAQNNNVSPYSFFGIGETSESNSVIESNMAGIGTSLNDPYQLYFSNPASYSTLKFTTYTFSAKNNYIRVDDGSNKDDASYFSLNYLSVAFSLGKKAGLNFGLKPNSKVGYGITNSFTNNFDESESNFFYGDGGTSTVFLGTGFQLPYHFNIGIEGNYTFGDITRRTLNRIEDVQLATMHQTTSAISGFSAKLGVQHSYKMKEKLNLKSGVTFELENKLANKGNERLFTLLNSSSESIIIPRDELINQDFNNTITNPLKTTFEIGVENENKWFAGVSYSFQDAIKFENDALQNSTINYSNYSKLAFGGYYIPKINSLTNYWKRVTYRAGFYSKQIGLKVGNTDVKDFGITFGLTLPSKRKLSNINLGFDVGKKGNTSNNLIKENYFNFKLSFSFTDKWFKKRKIN